MTFFKILQKTRFYRFQLASVIPGIIRFYCEKKFGVKRRVTHSYLTQKLRGVVINFIELAHQKKLANPAGILFVFSDRVQISNCVCAETVYPVLFDSCQYKINETCKNLLQKISKYNVRNVRHLLLCMNHHIGQPFCKKKKKFCVHERN